MSEIILPTAEQLATDMFVKHPGSYESFNRISFTGKQLREVAVAFAKLHVEAALKSCHTTSKLKWMAGESGYLKQEDVDLSYPIENIKL